MSIFKKFLSPYEKSCFFYKKYMKEPDLKKRKFYLNYSEQLMDFHTASGFDAIESEDYDVWDLFDVPGLIEDDSDVDKYEKYVKRRWIMRQAHRNDDLVLKNKKMLIKNNKSYEKSWDEFKRRSKYFT